MISEALSSIHKFLCRIHGIQSDHNYTPPINLLHGKNIPELDKQDVVNMLWSLIEDFQHILQDANAFPRRIDMWMDCYRPVHTKSTQTNETIESIDSKYTQITCSKSELDRRIQSFIKRKRDESDSFNRREFCKIPYDSKSLTCARTDAVFVRRQSEKSIVKVKKVRNVHVTSSTNQSDEPNLKQWAPLHPSTKISFNTLPSDVKERVNNLKKFLSPSFSYNDENIDIYQLIQNLESRLLYLETLSPEYFTVNNSRFSKESSTKDNLLSPEQIFSPKESTSFKNSEGDGNLMLLDMRINEIKEKLRKKAANMTG